MTLPHIMTTALVDLALPVVRLSNQLPKLIENPSSVTSAQASCRAAVDEFKVQAQRAGAAADEAADAAFALVALLDEKALMSGGPGSEAWLSDALQVRYYGELAAGEEFYTRLDALRARVEGGKSVLAVYQLVLALGFTGRYADKRGEEHRKGLVDRIARELAPTALPLSTQITASGSAVARAPVTWPWWVAAAAVIIAGAVVAYFVSGDVAGAAQRAATVLVGGR